MDAQQFTLFKGYLRAVRKLSDYCQMPPDKITEDQLRRFFLHQKNDLHYAYGTLRVSFSGVKFFYTRTCRRPWDTLATMKLQNAKTLPEVITFQQVHQIIDATTTLRMQTYFWTVYSLGLRMQEGLNLEVGDIDGERGLVHVHRGKGAKDRYIPLPSSTLDMLRRYWGTHRHKRFLFPADGRNHTGMSTATTTMSPTAVQGAMKKITRQLNFGKDKSTRWLEQQSPRLLPVHHFLVTFTVPDQVGSLLRRRLRAGYSALFDAGAGSIRDVGAATKSLRGYNLGFFGVLHTWSRDPMVYFVQHALPRGQQKIRYYGWMGSNFRVRLDEVKWLLEYLDSG